MGGFSGGDPAPTAAQLQALVKDGDLRFVLLGGRGLGGGSANERTQWVQASCRPVDPAAYGAQAASGGQLYDCAAAPTAAIVQTDAGSPP